MSWKKNEFEKQIGVIWKMFERGRIMLENGKRIMVLCAVLLCLFMTGCSNEFAKNDYDSREEIAKTSDHYAKSVSVFQQIDSGYSFTASRFDGRETLWSEQRKTAEEIEIEISFKLSKGQAKIVYVDSEGNVTTLMECSPETAADGTVSKTVSLKSGQNRIKLVGYDCEEIDLQILFEEL